MTLIQTKEQLKKNIKTLENYIENGNEHEANKAISLIERGICFVVYKVEGKLHFAPSRFIGYIDNGIEKHVKSDEKDGRNTNDVINEILKGKPMIDDNLEQEYFTYCHSLGFKPRPKGLFGSPHKFWDLSNDKKF